MAKKTTPLGSPCSPSWDDEWIAKVAATEERFGHRICGAKTPSVAALDARATDQQRHAYHVQRETDILNGRNPDKPDPLEPWVPCILKPNSPNGRCRFHGGTDLTGGRPGNRNAAIHGLYTRALRPCSTSCPMWDKCPLAGNDVAQMQPAQRPTCPYEKAQYNTALSDTLQYANTLAPLAEHDLGPLCATHGPATEEIPHLAQLAHQTAQLHVMVQRAATALREHPFIEIAETKFGDQQNKYSRPHAYLQAFLRLSSEYRRYVELLEKTAKHRTQPSPQPRANYKPDSEEQVMADLKVEAATDIEIQSRALRLKEETADHQRRIDNDTLLTPEAEEQLAIPKPPIHQTQATRVIHVTNDLIDAQRQAGAFALYNAALTFAPGAAIPLYETFKAEHANLHEYWRARIFLNPIPQKPKPNDPPQPDPPHRVLPLS